MLLQVTRISKVPIKYRQCRMSQGVKSNAWSVKDYKPAMIIISGYSQSVQLDSGGQPRETMFLLSSDISVRAVGSQDFQLRYNFWALRLR